MTKRIALILAVLMVASLAACGAEPEPANSEPTSNIVAEETQTVAEAAEQAEVDYEEVYRDVLHHVYDLLISEGDSPADTEDELGIFEAKQSCDAKQALTKVGYVFRDISGDGIPELLIAKNASGEILAIYTADGETPIFVRGGSSRNCLYLLKGSNTLYNYGASGAAYTGFGTLHLAENGQSVQWDDFYFTGLDNNSHMVYFHNTTGQWDTENSEKLDISADNFWAYNISEGAIKADLGLTRFIYMPGGSIEAPVTTADGVEVVEGTGTGIEVRLADYESGELDNCHLMDVSHGAERCELGFFAVGGNIVDINLYKIKCEVSDDGEVSLNADMPFAYIPYIKEEEPMLVYMDIPGDLPTMGFSYVDASGKTTYRAISISGKDGSVELIPFTPDAL